MTARARPMFTALGMRREVTPGKMPLVRARRRRNLAILLAGLMAGILLVTRSVASRSAGDIAHPRDAERARECDQRGGRWIAGGCALNSM
jgi:hypothetical protein